MCRRIVIVVVWSATVALAGTGATGVPPVQVDAATQATPETDEVGKLLDAYFRMDDPKRRSRLVEAIERAAHGDLNRVARAVQEVSLWGALPSPVGTFSFDSATGTTVPIAYRLPQNYDPALRYPMIVCMPGTGVAARHGLSQAALELGDAANGCVLICPESPTPCGFHQHVEAADDLQRLLRAARKTIHVDTDRVFILGFAQGGDDAWMAAITQPDSFAGVIVLSGYPPVPYPEQVYPFLLENLRCLPVLTVWRTADDPQATERQKRVAAHNRAIVEFAERSSLPVVGVEVPSAAPADLKPPPTELRKILTRRRSPPSPVVSHWFRYPPHGRAGWLRQVKFAGEVWEADQLAVAVSPAGDRERFIADVVKRKLAYLSGRIKGQTITVETRRSARVQLLLPMGIVDLSRPILVLCNGRKRYDRLLEPSARTLLERAYEQWEFQRPVVAQLSLAVRTDAPLD